MIRRLLLLTLLLAAALPSFAAADCFKGDVLFKKVTPQVTAFHDYQIKLYHQDCDAEPESRIAGFEIWNGSQRVYVQTGYSFAVGYALAQDQPPDSVKPKLGADFTGEGVPELLISESSGGAHCCYTFHLFRLGPQFSHIQDIPLLDDDEAAFVRRPGVKGLVLAAADYSAFANFPKGFAGSPAGRVFLSFQDGRFKPDAGLMKSNAPADAEIAKCASLFKPSRDWKEGQPSGLWYYATDLIYTGNADAAWKFLDAAWGGSATDKKQYLDDYRRRFMKSAYHPELMQLQQAPVSNESQKIDWAKQCLAYMHG
ncbi:MAG TPA: hypothetical protein VGM16_01390 [Gammaproteobacteria bacterium]|jgi:hypothetical protein